MEFVICLVYNLADRLDDLMVCERVYYDQATITRQLKGLAEADD